MNRLVPRSLRARLLLLTAVLLVAGIVVSDAVVTAALSGRLVARVDRQLQPIALAMSVLDPALLDQATDARTRNLTGALDLISELAVAYLGPDGKVVRSAAAGAGRGATPPRFEASLMHADPEVPRVIRGADGSKWRAVVRPRPGRGGVVVVAASLADVDATIGQLRLICLATGLIVVVVLTAVGWLAIRAGLRPLHTIEATANAIAGGDLAHRIPDPGPPNTEVARLTTALNGMLAQIERSFAARAASEERMRRFVADASHELRTPLSGIKGSAELHLMGAAEPDDVHRAMRRIDTEAARLTALVEDLLLLARLDESAAGPVVDPAPMDLRTLAADARHDLHALDPDRPVRLTGPAGADGGFPPVPAEALVLGDEDRLRQVVVNLVGNVHAHTPVTAGVRIGVGRVGDEAVLEVADSGPGLTGEQAERVFERFYRADGSRSRGAGRGAGLGLAIARSLVTAHGGRVELRPTPGGGATFRLCLPWAAEAGKLTEPSQNPGRNGSR
ncbi:HAMP domain-containing sensor histidine kinase [Actinoplanes sp. NPDC051411]|uniref:sensor histidine kinase n=1 Tax=Actinoplanes sp. NPDC051411 TaxID=3155522 RepID=UPI003412C015